jgi:hypothetical protein
MSDRSVGPTGTLWVRHSCRTFSSCGSDTPVGHSLLVGPTLLSDILFLWVRHSCRIFSSLGNARSEQPRVDGSESAAPLRPTLQVVRSQPAKIPHTLRRGDLPRCACPFIQPTPPIPPFQARDSRNFAGLWAKTWVPRRLTRQNRFSRVAETVTRRLYAPRLNPGVKFVQIAGSPPQRASPARRPS